MKRKQWSQGLRDQTRKAVDEMWVNPATGALHMKCIDGRCGSISVGNLISGKLQIFTTEGAPIQFDSVDALLAAGWAID